MMSRRQHSPHLQLLTTAWALGGLASASAQTKAASTASATATVTAAPTSAPKIEFETNVYNFGKVSAGELVRHDFIFTNTGKATLEITAVRPGCGCTTAGEWDKRVEPGKTGVIPLQFNSANFGGIVTKSATVTCNDPGQSNVVLQISGTVWKPIEVTPTMATFNVASDSQTNETRVVRIVNNLEEPLTLSDLQCSNRSFQVELKTVQPGKEFALHVTAVPPFTTPTVYAPITLKTSSAKMPTINVSAYVTVQQAVMVTPQQMNLPQGPLASATSRSILIRTGGTNTLKLSDAAVNVAGAEVRVQETQPGRMFNLTVNFPAGFHLKPEEKAEVTVKSDHPKFPLIRVPVFQTQPAAAAAALRTFPPPPAAAAQSGSSPLRVVSPQPTPPGTPQK